MQQCDIIILGECMTIGGDVKFKACQFPFTYKGKSHDKCISEDGPGQDMQAGKFWCPTQTNIVTNELIHGKHGFCEDSCPKEGKISSAYRKGKR